MKSQMTILMAVAVTALLLAVVAAACGGAEDSDQDWTRQGGIISERLELDMPAAAPAPAATAAPGAPGFPGLPGAPGPAGPPGRPGPMAQAASAAPAAAIKKAVVEREVVKEVELAAPSRSESAGLTGSDGSTQTQAQLASQRRIIIRTVNMSIVVDEIQAAIDDIYGLAVNTGGWVVSTDRRERHSGVISVRVLAANLDLVIEEIREMAKDVESEVSTSQDVTDEYFDLQSRLKNQQATEEALIRLLDRAESVEHALAVQRELSSVQENVERLLGRIKLLEETSAYSLITVSLTLAPVDMSVDAGPDQSVAAYTPIRFRATFRPPEGMDSHVITWDFGDGSEPVIVVRSAPTTSEGERVTATVTHEYGDPKDSPFIAQVDINSFGEGGISEGEDTMIVSVSETPVIEAFVEVEDDRALQNEVVEFSGSFTRPQGLSNVRYQWDFGDGTSSRGGRGGRGHHPRGHDPRVRRLPFLAVQGEVHDHRRQRGGRDSLVRRGAGQGGRGPRPDSGRLRCGRQCQDCRKDAQPCSLGADDGRGLGGHIRSGLGASGCGCGDTGPQGASVQGRAPGGGRQS